MNNSEGGQKAQPSQMRMAMDFFYDSDEAEYCRHFAFSKYPDEEMDEEGNYFVSGCSTGVDIIRAIMFEKGLFPFTKEEYLNNQDIQNTIVSIGLESEKFWWAIQFIHHLADTKYGNGYKAGDSNRHLLEKTVDILSRGNASLSVKGEKREVVNIENKDLLGVIRDLIQDFLEKNVDNSTLDMIPFGIGDSCRVEESPSMQMCFEAECFQDIFKKECKDKKLPSHLKAGGVSREKLLLISRLFFLMGLTKTETFLYISDSLKGIRKSYKKKNIYRVSGRYLK